jgi:hypothetical protein
MLIGFLGTAYPILEIPMMIIVCVTLAFVLCAGALDFAKGYWANGIYSNSADKVLKVTLSTTLVIVTVVLIAIFLGVYIAL